jgi:hypothetical protein
MHHAPVERTSRQHFPCHQTAFINVQKPLHGLNPTSCVKEHAVPATAAPRGARAHLVGCLLCALLGAVPGLLGRLLGGLQALLGTASHLHAATQHSKGAMLSVQHISSWSWHGFEQYSVEATQRSSAGPDSLLTAHMR